MGVPKRKTSRARRDKRRNHQRLAVPSRSTCPQCHEVKLPHHVCPQCGTYRGREILAVSQV
ncbi:MAG: 50S ribosomal protein L32 [Candidatus Tectimicrobiota bacterium]|nr:MAG: 50S ribosomal protein L32 [Candidatus Tectomicrobia bacterium]